MSGWRPRTSESPITTAPRTRRVANGRVRLHVREWPGDGPTVVLVHGYPDTSTLWDGVVPDLAADAHVVAYDVRGAGRSTRPADVGAYAFGHLLDDLRAVVEATAPGRRIHLVGHDWGAIQGWEAAADPATVGLLASFTALSAPSFDLVGRWVRGGRGAGHVAAVLGQLRRSWYIGAFQLPVLGPAVWRLALADRWPAVRARYEDRDDLPPPAPTLVEDAVAGIALYRANAGRVTRPVRDGVGVPTRVLAGARDAFVSPRVWADVARRPDVEVELLPDGHHWLPLSDPARVADVVRDHVATVGAHPATSA